jgi:hypothetical protein
MEKAFPSGEYKTWTTYQILLPHLKEVMQFTLEFVKNNQLNVTRIASQCGRYLYLMGRYEEAEGMH